MAFAPALWPIPASVAHGGASAGLAAMALAGGKLALV